MTDESCDGSQENRLSGKASIKYARDIDMSTHFAIAAFYFLTALASHGPFHAELAGRFLEVLSGQDFAEKSSVSLPSASSNRTRLTASL